MKSTISPIKSLISDTISAEISKADFESGGLSDPKRR